MKNYALILLNLFVINLVCAQSRLGKDYAVFFYVTTFKPSWISLPETKTEVESLQLELYSEYGFQCELVANPTKQQMRSKIREYNSRLTENDQVLYFFSMHGNYNVLGDRGYLVGTDGMFDDAYGDTWLSYDDLRIDLSPCKAKHILLALDACHSGAFGIRNKSGPDAPVYNQEDDCLTQVNKTMQYGGRQYCTSGNKDAKTPAKSLFANRFLEALRKGGDGVVLHFDDLEYWLGKVNTPKPESGTFAGHVPGGDFLFVKRNGCLQMRDRDGDGIPDEKDKCPDNFGIKSNFGCPEAANYSNTDSDYDGIFDVEDKCPDKFGIRANFGCPEIGTGDVTADVDRDGIPDDQDGCPSDYGTTKANGCPDKDNDGIPDKEDSCPTESGTSKANGCPDRDGDGVPDKSDKCVQLAGEVRWQGCPDSDGDGLPNHEDQCPNQKGLLVDKGCPPVDRDNDGVPDKTDRCPDKAGETRWQGCPDSDGDGLADHEDLCPGQKGLAADRGCPPADQDKDGVPDKSDKCPTKAGKSYLEGCPDPAGDFLTMVLY